MAAAPPAPPVLIVVATLHIVCGEQQRGRWTVQPTATYACNRCWYRETVRGAERVRAFASHIRTTHRQACPSAAAERKAA